jgi:hypothetical protein
MFYPTIKALQDWMIISMNADSKKRYPETYFAFEKVVTSGLLILAIASESRRNFAVWSGLLMANQSWWPSLPGKNLDTFLENAKNDPEVKRRFFDNPDLQWMTSMDEWKIMCAMKMDPDASRVMHLVWTATRGNGFFETETGYLGMAPHGLAEGDVVALVQGLRMPMVLRPVASLGEKYFKVVSTAYIHGVMNGELWDEAATRKETLILI